VYISGRPAETGPQEVGMGFLAWIVVGLIAGWLAGQVMKGGGYGTVVDIILGILAVFWAAGSLGCLESGRGAA
jgi:uncharacterized membrane protein YeaQ/YmgE (transglycosylase-associated protein family)